LAAARLSGAGEANGREAQDFTRAGGRRRHARHRGEVLTKRAQNAVSAAQEIATIGDQPNDVLMFKRSGFSIAMGNASDEVKAQAAAVTDSYNDEGFAKAMEAFILGSAR
jgi:hydroxymethylpyrimidine pyrophosphatase-like HAD family hydrolase